MIAERYEQFREDFFLIMKITIGSCISFLLARELNLEFETSAGIITLLTILNTRWATLKLAVLRVASFFMTVFIAWLVFSNISRGWAAYGLFIFLLCSAGSLVGWQKATSVNAVIGTHFLTTHNFDLQSVLNEFYLVMIGISVAVVLNLFHSNKRQKKRLKENLRRIEEMMQDTLERVAESLRRESTSQKLWEDIIHLEEYLAQCVERARQYRENTFAAHTQYYIRYVEMRMEQFNVLHNLHYEIEKIREMPEQAQILAEYISYLKPHVAEMNVPEKQLEELARIAAEFKKAPLPETRGEFEGRAVLYHMMLELEEFLVLKKQFVDSLSKKELEVYFTG